LSAGLTAALLAGLGVTIKLNDPLLIEHAPTSYIIVPLLVIATGLFFSRRFATVAAAAIMLSALMLNYQTNPVYRGIYDLSETEIGNEIQAIDAADDGTWVGVGRYENIALLVQTGVGSYSGVQNYPSDEMWEQIDPTGRYDQLWNRLAHVQWKFGEGDPEVTSPQGDVVVVRLDPCAPFAQENVQYVLTSEEPPSLDCLSLVSTTEQGQLTMRIYEVVPPE